MRLPPLWRPGDPLLAKHLNMLRDAILGEIRVGRGLTLQRTAGKATIGLSGSQIIPPTKPLIVAKITAASGTENGFAKYRAVEQEPLSSGGWQDKPGGIVFDASDPGSSHGDVRELNGLKGLLVGTVGVVSKAPTDSGIRYVFNSGISLGNLFAVDVATDGGSAGDETEQCSYTYAVTDLDGNSISDGVSPAMNRPSKGAMVAATRGTAYYKIDSGGALEFVLHWVDEVPDVETC